MSIYFENETGKTFDFDYEEVLTSVIKKSLDYVKCPYECCVNVTLVHSDEIREINKTQRDVDDVTDVLSFPMIDYEVAGDFDFLRDKGVDYFDPDSGELLLGDIVICVEKIESQAKAFGHGEKREVAFLTAHSTSIQPLPKQNRHRAGHRRRRRIRYDIL